MGSKRLFSRKLTPLWMWLQAIANLLPIPPFHGSMTSLEPIGSRLFGAGYPTTSRSPAAYAREGPIMDVANTRSLCATHRRNHTTIGSVYAMPKHNLVVFRFGLGIYSECA